MLLNDLISGHIAGNSREKLQKILETIQKIAEVLLEKENQQSLLNGSNLPIRKLFEHQFQNQQVGLFDFKVTNLFFCLDGIWNLR
jgi:hypothetical protein